MVQDENIKETSATIPANINSSSNSKLFILIFLVHQLFLNLFLDKQIEIPSVINPSEFTDHNSDVDVYSYMYRDENIKNTSATITPKINSSMF